MGTIVKGPIGTEDIRLKTSGTTRGTFTRTDSNGRTLTLNKFDGADLQFRTIAKQVDDLVDGGADVAIIPKAAGISGSIIALEDVAGKNLHDLFDGGYDVPIKPSDIITRGPWRDVRAFGAVGDGSTDDTVAIQAALDAGYFILFPIGNYLISASLVLKPWHYVAGHGRAFSIITDFANEDASGTRISINSANPLFTTAQGGATSDDVIGTISLQDMTLYGGKSGAIVGTRGINVLSSDEIIINRVNAHWFEDYGFYFKGSLLARVYDCRASFNAGDGLFMDFGDHGGSGSSNSYMSTIRGGSYSQNEDAGIRLGTSSVNVNILGVDFESSGNFFPAGDGFGLYLDGECRGVNVEGCWFEDNKVHVVVGKESNSAVITVPKATRLVSNQFWAVDASDDKIRVNSGNNLLIESNEFFGAVSTNVISVNAKADNPIIRGNFGQITIEDDSDNNVSYNNTGLTNAFEDPDVSGWTLTRVTVAENVTETSPAGQVPVYEVTVTSTGLNGFQAPNMTLGTFQALHTYGAWFKTDSATEQELYWSLASDTPTEFVTSAEADSFIITNDWKWFSFGRTILTGGGGNVVFSINGTFTDTDTFYVSGVSARPGIIHEPYVLNTTATDTITKTIEISNSEIKALVATPKELVAAQGANTVIEVVSLVLILDFGSEVLAEPSNPDNLAIEYDGGAGTQIDTWDTTNFITAAADHYEIRHPSSVIEAAAVTDVNKNVVLINIGSDYTGNASNDTTITAKITYRVHATGL